MATVHEGRQRPDPWADRGNGHDGHGGALGRLQHRPLHQQGDTKRHAKHELRAEGAAALRGRRGHGQRDGAHGSIDDAVRPRVALELLQRRRMRTRGKRHCSERERPGNEL